MSPSCPARLLLASLLGAIGVAGAAVTSETHPVLARALAADPTADTDANGILSLSEYTALSEARPRGGGARDRAPFPTVLANGEVVIHEFEDNPLDLAGGWSREGEAFPQNLEAGTRMLRKRVGPFAGRHLLTTITNSDEATGRLLSPGFLIDLDYLVITMSGGRFPRQVCANLLVDDEIVRTATGTNDDYFERVAFDLREFRGRRGRLEFLDSRRGLWGHLNIDRVVLAAAPGPARLVQARPDATLPGRGRLLTTGSDLRGPLAVRDGRLIAGDAPPAADHPVLLALSAAEPGRESVASAIRFRNGEIWRAHVGELREASLAIRSAVLGTRSIPLARIASIELRPAAESAPRDPGHLYRTNGEPVPGTLVWVREKDLAIDCPLGVVPIPRHLVERFVLARPDASAPTDGDELLLHDGSRLFGRTRFENDSLVLQHEILGEVTITWDEVRALRRHDPSVTWLDQLPLEVLERTGPVLPPPAPRVRPGDRPDCFRAIRILPNTRVRVPLAPAGHHRTLRTRLAVVPGAGTDVTVRLTAGDTLRWERRLKAGDAPVPLSLDLAAGDHLTISVEFAGPIGFPCGIELRDPHLLTRRPAPAPPQPADHH